MKIQIVIPSINLWGKYTKRCIESIKTKHEYRILLVDNASTDETREESGKMVSNTFFHKRNEERWSCAKSWNYGIKDAFERGYDYVLVLNNDIVLHPDAIDRLVERFESDKGLAEDGSMGMVTCLDVRGDCQSIPEYLFDKKSVEYEKVSEAPHPNFSAYMINKKCWDEVGEFDEGFEPAYFEDNDYHRRMQLAHIKSVVYPPALFFHFGSRTQNEAVGKPIVSSPRFEANRNYYVGKWGGTPGTERFDRPFGNELNSIKWVKQNNG